MLPPLEDRSTDGSERTSNDDRANAQSALQRGTQPDNRPISTDDGVQVAGLDDVQFAEAGCSASRRSGDV